jgi:flagellar motor protein MotB
MEIFRRQNMVLLLCAVAQILTVQCYAFDLSLPLPESSQTRQIDELGSSTEQQLMNERSLTPWLLDPAIFGEDQPDLTQTEEVVEELAETVKLTELMPAIHFDAGDIEIPDHYLIKLAAVLERMRDKRNLRLHFVGHADSQPLSPELEAIYTDNTGLSRERAGTVAEYCQKALGLPAEAISYAGLGDNKPIAGNDTIAGQALNRRVEVEVWYDKIETLTSTREVPIPREVNRIKVCRTEEVCKLRYKDGQGHRARLRNLVSPLLYKDGLIDLSDSFLQQLARVYASLGSKNDVQIKFIAYTDDSPLSERQKRIYGDHNGLSKAVARRAALAVQEALSLPSQAVASEGRGSLTALTSSTPKARALNRRIEVEFWHADPLQNLPDEPQICPDQSGAETVTRIHKSPSGALESIYFDAGQPQIESAALSNWRRALAEVADKTNPRLRFTGYISNERLDRRTATIYGDDIGLSLARARRAMEAAQTQMQLSDQQVEFDGRGYVQSDDVVNLGFIEADESRVEVQVVYDELAILDDYEGVEITRITRDVELENPYALNLMRISVDGKPLDDPGKSSADVQRCTDVALERASISFKHDSLLQTPRLNITAWPRSARYADLAETDFIENRIDFQLYSNYRNYFDRAEVRIFTEEQSLHSEPLAQIELDQSGQGYWLADFPDYSAPGVKLKYLLRVGDAEGNFDQTRPQPLWIIDQIEARTLLANPRKELLAGYGSSRLAQRNIQVHGGAVQAFGQAIPEGHEVWLAGYPVPVDDRGRFSAEEILPQGLHTVEVAVLDDGGNGELYLRDLELNRSDWFHVGIADLTLSGNATNGPASLLDPDNARYSEDFSLQGRLAFYTRGRFDNGWALTASADTREGSLDDIFSNFLDKSSDSLLSRIDPDLHYPTLGDDSTVLEDAPTDGKFYLRLDRDETYALWGNSKVSHQSNELAQVSRDLYGLRLHYQPAGTTSFGEQKLKLDGYVADPGTISGRDELRGTGGSLYYLSQQDILDGSESLWIQVRDKDSGLVLASEELTADTDYDIDSIQGRILLSDVLPTTADDDLISTSASISGNPVYLVAYYEYTPDVTEIDTLVTGGRADYWFNDYFKLGATVQASEEADISSQLGAIDLSLRKSASTWLKLELGQTSGNAVTSSSSSDGGYSYSSADSIDEETTASAYHLEGSFAFTDIREGMRGRTTFYLQSLDEGYSSTGLSSTNAINQYGFNIDLPLFANLSNRIKYDLKTEEDSQETETTEYDLSYRLNDHWSLSSGLRHDSTTALDDDDTDDEGDLTDLTLRADYNSKARWSSYGFLQATLQATSERETNNRAGIGGSWRISDRFNLNSEVSQGDQGTAARLGSDFLYSDRTTYYLNYSLENETDDDGITEQTGTAVSGAKTRYSDVTSLYVEESYSHGDTPTGLVHTAGVELTPNDRLKLKVSLDLGSLKDPDSGSVLERTAAATSIGYGFEHISIASGLEYRVDNSEQDDGSYSEQSTWLFKNSFKYRISDNWRLLGKFNISMSESSLGTSYDSDYTEAVLGYAYRPVDFDRLNMLLKYTYFYNMPSSDDDSSTTTYIQRSHIAAIDLMYDLTPRWTIGGKYAYRLSQVALDRDDPEYFDSNAHLFVARADWHFLHRWDALVEGRILDLPDAQDRRSGTLVALYRHFGNHFKAGVGYNFCDFSDDLTQLDYRHQGLFFNVIGKF